MSAHAWFCVVVIVLMMYALFRRLAGPDVILVGGATLLLTTGVIDLGGFLAGFSNEGLATVAVLYAVAAGLRETGGMTMLTQPFLGRPTSVLSAQFRMLPPVAISSAFLNNTPVVAMFMPVIEDWAKKTGISSSKLYMPLSYAAILGGTCTLIGTSTNLIVNGLYRNTGADPLGMFTIAAVGLPALIVGGVYICLLTPKLLPDRKGQLNRDIADTRNYTVEMLVETGGPIDGQTIEKAGLRHLPGLYLMDVERDGQRIVAVAPDQVLLGNDRLIFVGVVDSVKDLQRIRGLTPATDQVFKLNDPRPNRILVEAVVSDNCPLRGKSIREGKFRTMYDAVVIAVHRNGQRIMTKIGDIVLQPGDTLLVETHQGFVEQQRNRRDFFLTSPVEGSQPVRHNRAWVSIGILIAMVVLATTGALSLLNAALLAVGFMVLTRCLSATQARRSINWQILLVIAAALAVGRAMQESGLAAAVATGIIDVASRNPILTLLAVYVVTNVFTELITNNAAAVLMFPIVMSAAESLQVSPMPFIITIMIAASASFSTPIGYQTNLMVYGAGGYHFSDYVKFGLPLNLLVLLVTMLVAPIAFPFAAAG